MRIGSVSVRLRTLASVGVLAVGIPALALTSVHRGAADTVGLNISQPATAVGSTLGSVRGTASNLSGTRAGSSMVGSNATSAGPTGSTGCPTSGLPADKMTVAASVLDQAGPNADVTILAACMRTSSPADLVFQLSSECSIFTDVATTGNNNANAEGKIRMWVEIDGQPVGVAPSHQGTSDDGRVTFCDRAQTQQVSGFLVEQPTIEEIETTLDANAFNWVAMNVGNGVHLITVHAELSQATGGDATAKEEIGRRTLVVQTTETAQNMAAPTQ